MTNSYRLTAVQTSRAIGTLNSNGGCEIKHDLFPLLLHSAVKGFANNKTLSPRPFIYQDKRLRYKQTLFQPFFVHNRGQELLFDALSSQPFTLSGKGYAVNRDLPSQPLVCRAQKARLINKTLPPHPHLSHSRGRRL